MLFKTIARNLQKCQTEIQLIYLIYGCSPIVLKRVFAGIARNPRYWPDIAYYRVITQKIQLEKPFKNVKKDHAFTNPWSHDHSQQLSAERDLLRVSNVSDTTSTQKISHASHDQTSSVNEFRITIQYVCDRLRCRKSK